MSSSRNSAFARAAVLAIALAVIVTSCSREPENAPPGGPVKPANWEVQTPDELFSVIRGAVVVDHSGEISFGASCMSAADGESGTYWTNPPRDLSQWMILELPAKSLIRQVGASNGKLVFVPRSIRELKFESSTDGSSFSELRTVTLRKDGDNQLFEVKPTEARFVRVTTLANFGDPYLIDVPTILVKGSEVEPAPALDVAGRWKIYENTLDLRQDGRAVYGWVNQNPPMLIYGAVEGRVVRYAWSRGRAYGLGYFSVNRERTKLSGAWWFDQYPDRFHVGQAWYGERQGDAAPFDLPVQQIAQTQLAKTGRFPLYTLIFAPDGSIDRQASRSAFEFIRLALNAFPKLRVKLVVTEFDDRDDKKNLEVSRERAKALSAAIESEGIPRDRIVIEPIGSPMQLADRSTPMHRMLYTRVDFAFAEK